MNYFPVNKFFVAEEYIEIKQNCYKQESIHSDKFEFQSEFSIGLYETYKSIFARFYIKEYILNIEMGIDKRDPDSNSFDQSHQTKTVRI